VTFFRAEGISDIYPALLEHALENGEEVSPRGQSTLEVCPLVFELLDPTKCLVLQRARRLNYAFAIAERLALLGGSNDPDMLSFYVPRIREFVNCETGCFDGAYGPRVRPQLDFVYRELIQDPNSRRAVVSIFSPSDQRPSLDIPCTLTLQFLLRHGKLDLVVNMRSSDLFLGLPYDVSQFAFLQQVVASWLAVEPGRYIQWAASAHVYQADLALAALIPGSDVVPDLGLDAPNLQKDETMAQVDVVLEIERNLRHANGSELSDSKVGNIDPAFLAHLRVLARYASKKAETQSALALT